MNAAVDGRWPARWVAQSVVLTVHEVFTAHTSDMGSPGDFYMEHSETFYTDRGLRTLAVGLEELGYLGAAEILRRKLEPARVRPLWWMRDMEDAA